MSNAFIELVQTMGYWLDLTIFHWWEYILRAHELLIYFNYFSLTSCSSEVKLTAWYKISNKRLFHWSCSNLDSLHFSMMYRVPSKQWQPTCQNISSKKLCLKNKVLQACSSLLAFWIVAYTNWWWALVRHTSPKLQSYFKCGVSASICMDLTFVPC